MVEETIRAIRETEKQADGIVENARRESERIRKEAEERSAKIREEIIKNAQAEAGDEAEKARLQGAETEQRAKSGYEEEIAALKASAAGKEKEAVEMVLSLLA